MGVFNRGTKRDDKKAAQAEQWQAELDRISALPLSEFADEVMQRGWGHGAIGEHTEIKLIALFDRYAPMNVAFGVDLAPRLRIEDRIKEAAQALTNAGLLVTQATGSDGASLMYRKSQAGQEALDAGNVRAIVG
jgi:hypothetical protein